MIELCDDECEIVSSNTLLKCTNILMDNESHSVKTIYFLVILLFIRLNIYRIKICIPLSSKIPIKIKLSLMFIITGIYLV